MTTRVMAWIMLPEHVIRLNACEAVRRTDRSESQKSKVSISSTAVEPAICGLNTHAYAQCQPPHTRICAGAVARRRRTA